MRIVIITDTGRELFRCHATPTGVEDPVVSRTSELPDIRRALRLASELCRELDPSERLDDGEASSNGV